MSGRLSVLALVLVLFTAGCGDDSPTVAEAPTSSPINDLLGIDVALRSSDLVTLEREAEAGLVECMAAAGFEYVPIDFAAQLDPGGSVGDPDSRAFAEVYGYGVSTAASLLPVDPTEFVDPNDAIRTEFSEAELEAYVLALYGEIEAEDEPVPLADQSGCLAEAYRDVYEARSRLTDVERFFAVFDRELADLEARFRADPRFVELEAQWSACMSDQGHDFAERDDIFLAIDERIAQTVGALDPSAPEAVELLDEVVAYEQAVAVADFDCTVPVADEMRLLRYRYEAEFIDDNRGRLPAPAAE